MKVFLAVCVAFFSLSFSYGQLVDIARVEYTVIPGKSSDFNYNRKRFAFNYPVKVKKDAYFFFGLEYSQVDLEFKEEPSAFDASQTDDFRLMDINLTYTYKIDEDWRFAVRLVPGWSSNLESGDFLFDDTFLSGTMVFIKDLKASKDVKKPNRLIVGVAYSNTSGVIFPIPFVSYYRKFHPKWSYNLGVPTTNLQFHASERVRVKLLGQLDGFNSNLQNGLTVNEDLNAERFRLTMILMGMRYEYKVTHNIEWYLNTTHSLNTIIQLRKTRDNLYTLPQSKVWHFTTGLRLKI